MLPQTQSLSFAGALPAGELAAPPPAASPASARPPRAEASSTLIREEQVRAAEQWFYDQCGVIDADVFDTIEAMGPDLLIERWREATAAGEQRSDEPAVAFVPTADDWRHIDSLNRRHERRLSDERTIAPAPILSVSRPFSDAEIAEIEADLRRPGPIRVLEPGRFDAAGTGSADPFPTTGGEAFRALGGREWAATLPADDDAPTPGLLMVVAFLGGVSGLAIGIGLGIAFAELARQVLS